MGLKSTVFVVLVMDAGHESSVILDDLDFEYLHEQLLKTQSEHECIATFPRRPFSLFDTHASVDRRREAYGVYLASVLCSPSCVGNSVLWLTLGLGPESGVVPRFLLRMDNLSQLDELSMHAHELYRLCNVPTISSLQRCLETFPASLSVIGGILFRLFTNKSSFRPIIESCLLSLLFRLLLGGCLFGGGIGIIQSLLVDIVESNPNALFVYLQRDNGLMDLVEWVSGTPAGNPCLNAVAQCILTGVLASPDIELTLTDKSTLGMSLLNKLLVKGQDTDAELAVASTLVYLYSRGLVFEYSDKISRIVDSITAATTAYNSQWYFRRIVSILLSEKTFCIKFGAFLVVISELRPIAGVSFRVAATPLRAALSAPLADDTKSLISEALVMLFETDGNTYMFERFAKKCAKWNNFLIEANFEISNKPIGDLTKLQTLLDRISSAPLAVAAQSAITLDNEIHSAHSDAVNEILKCMLEVKAHLAEAERLKIDSIGPANAEIRLRTAELETRLKMLNAEKKQFESELTQLHEPETDAEYVLESLRNGEPNFANRIAQIESNIIDTMRKLSQKSELAIRMRDLNLATYTSSNLAVSMATIDEKITLRNAHLRALRGLLVQLTVDAQTLIELIDGDQGTGDYVTPETEEDF